MQLKSISDIPSWRHAYFPFPLQCCTAFSRVLCGAYSLSPVCLFGTPWTVCSPLGSSDRGNAPSKNTGVGCHALLQGVFPNQGIEPMPPTLQASARAGKSKNTGVGGLPLLQRVFLTQESNQGLLHWRWVLYQLSYRGSPFCHKNTQKFIINFENVKFKEGTSLVVQLRIHLPMQGIWVRSPVGELRSHIPHATEQLNVTRDAHTATETPSGQKNPQRKVQKIKYHTLTHPLPFPISANTHV